MTCNFEIVRGKFVSIFESSYLVSCFFLRRNGIPIENRIKGKLKWFFGWIKLLCACLGFASRVHLSSHIVVVLFSRGEIISKNS